MESSPARHQFPQSSAASTVAVGLSLSRQHWVAHADHGPDVVAVPPLDGTLLFDPAIRARAAGDFGHIASSTPWAVLIPASIEDVERIVRFANRYHLRIAGRSTVDESYSVFGQSQVAAGIVIDMSGLSAVHALEPGESAIWVEAGVCWRDVLAATLPSGKSPPVMPDYLGLSVGGSLSVGGIGGRSHRAGFTVDNVRALEVITGNGDRVRCSPTEQPFLFSSVLGGLGQFGIIVRACLALRDVAPRMRIYSLVYDDLRVFLKDQTRVVEEARVEHIEGIAEPNPDGPGWRYQLEIGVPLRGDGDGDGDDLLAGLHYLSGGDAPLDLDYARFACRRDSEVARLRMDGASPAAHPRLDLLVPAEQAGGFIGEMLERAPTAHFREGTVVIRPLRRSATRSRYPVLPAGELCYLVSFRPTIAAPTPERIEDVLVKNRLCFEKARARGGTFYPAGALPLEPADWRTHFGRPLGWVLFGVAKRMFDHRFVLTPGQQIFRRP